MLRELSDNTYYELRSKLQNECGFKTRWDAPADWIALPKPHKRFAVGPCWNEEQEKLVNSFFESLSKKEIYAYDWQSDCFLYSPSEEIEPYYCYYDSEREREVCFPTYYPDGEFHFFFDTDWQYGLFGHPIRNEIVVMGQELVEMFEANALKLDIAEV